MADYTFRIKIKRANRRSIMVKERVWSGSNETLDGLKLRSQNKSEPINESDDWIFMKSGFESKEEAQKVGKAFFRALKFVFARLKIGIKWGKRGSKTTITKAGLNMFGDQFNGRCLQDQDGLMVYETEPKPKFVSAEAKGTVLSPVDKFEQLLIEEVCNPREVTKEKEIALELFNASFFQPSLPARFVLLITAVEVLAEQPERGKEALEHVKELITLTQENTKLSQRQKDSLLGSIGRLKKESVGRSCAALIQDKFPSDKYGELKAVEFFNKCYGLRSDFVHGDISDETWDLMGQNVNDLETMVSDLLCCRPKP